MTGNKKRQYRSITEFKKENFPKSFEESEAKTVVDPFELATELARESLDKLKDQLG
jgi:hypothetical protein